MLLVSPVTVVQTPTHTYRIRSAEASSQKYGPCEVCGAPCSDVHLQSAWEKVPDTARPFVTAAGVKFGHASCLALVRR